MKTTLLFLMFNALCLAALGQNVEAQNQTRARRPVIQRDAKLESAITDRYGKIAASLTPEAKKKLAIAALAVRKALVKSPQLPDPYPIARAEVTRQFPALSPAQLEAFTFYVLAEVSQQAPASASARKIGDARSDVNAKSDVKSKLDSLSEMGEMESLRLLMAMDRMSKLMSTLSNLLKKMSDTASSIIQNIK